MKCTLKNLKQELKNQTDVFKYDKKISISFIPSKIVMRELEKFEKELRATLKHVEDMNVNCSAVWSFYLKKILGETSGKTGDEN